MQVLKEDEGFNFLVHCRAVETNFTQSIQNDCDRTRALQCEKK